MKEKEQPKKKALYLDAPVTKQQVKDLKDGKYDIIIPALGTGSNSKVRIHNNRKSFKSTRIQTTLTKEGVELKNNLTLNNLHEFYNENGSVRKKYLKKIVHLKRDFSPKKPSRF